MASCRCFSIFQYRFNLKILGIYAAPLAALIMIVASLLPSEPFRSMIYFKSVWLVIHIITYLSVKRHLPWPAAWEFYILSRNTR